jgi:hypothetical protein
MRILPGEDGLNPLRDPELVKLRKCGEEAFGMLEFRGEIVEKM